jgi:hypothetical protein
MATMWRPAKEPREIGEKLIEQHYSDISDSGVRVEWWFRNEASRKGGKLVLGSCTKITGRVAYMTQQGTLAEGYIEPKFLQYYVIEIAEDTWMELSAKQRVALVDHELSHILIEHDDEDGFTYKTVSHDIEEFAAVLQRHGLWKPDLEWFARNIKGAMTLPFEDANRG